MIKYPKSIDRVGIEFEGIYSPLLSDELEELRNDGLLDISFDGSVNNTDRELYAHYSEYECITKPLLANNLNKILKRYNEWHKKNLYILNRSTGLHFHISVKENGFGSICVPSFYIDVVDYFRKNQNKVYTDRKLNRYCYADMDKSADGTNEELQSQFRENSRNRYHAINYSVEGNSGNRVETVEIRLYGGSHATIDGLSDSIQAVLNIIHEHYMRKKVYTEGIDFSSEEKSKVVDIESLKTKKDVYLPLVETYIKSRTKRFIVPKKSKKYTEFLMRPKYIKSHLVETIKNKCNFNHFSF